MPFINETGQTIFTPPPAPGLLEQIGTTPFGVLMIFMGVICLILMVTLIFTILKVKKHAEE